jgi:hypothetical protein
MGWACSADGDRAKGKLEGKRLLGRQTLDDRIILRWILRKWDVGLLIGLSWLRIGTVSGQL